MGEINIGERLREFRKSKNLSLKKLGEMTNLTSSLLSQIEKGYTNPSINTLKIISKNIDIPLYLFFKEESFQQSNFIVKPSDRKVLKTSSKNGVIYELLTPSISSNIEFMLLTFEKNTSSSEIPISHDSEEVVYILEGKIALSLEDNIFHLEKGDSLILEAQKKHRWINISDSTSQIIFAITPPTF